MTCARRMVKTSASVSWGSSTMSATPCASASCSRPVAELVRDEHDRCRRRLADRLDVLDRHAVGPARAVQNDLGVRRCQLLSRSRGLDGSADDLDLGVRPERLADLGEACARTRDEHADGGVIAHHAPPFAGPSAFRNDLSPATAFCDLRRCEPVEQDRRLGLECGRRVLRLRLRALDEPDLLELLGVQQLGRVDVRDLEQHACAALRVRSREHDARWSAADG